jgi:MFS family permease
VIFLTEQRSWSLPAAASILAILQLAGAAARPIAGAWSDRDGDRIGPIRIAAAGAAGLLFAIGAAMSTPDLLLIPLMLLAGVASMCWNGLAFAAAGELAQRAGVGLALGLQNTILYAGGVVIPVGWAELVSTLGWRIGYIALGLVAVSSFLVLRPLQREIMPRRT